MIFGIANIVAGGPIYNSNKIKFLKDNGWNVIVFPTDSGDVLIKTLEEYNSNPCEFLCFSPYILGKRKTNHFIEYMAKKIPKFDEAIIETGTDYTALWGELLAKKIGARHIVMFLDETNERVNNFSASFYEFKYQRDELYSISEKSILHIFSPYFKITNPERNVWEAHCSNSVAEIDSNLVDSLPNADYMIGSIGRLDKTFVPNIIKGVCLFADEHKDNKIGLCLFGGADKKYINQIYETINVHKNIEVFISGYIWPIPQNIFSKFDVFISGAGSAYVSANMNIPTINMDVITNKPIGFVDNASTSHNIPISNKKNDVRDYLNEVLINSNSPKIMGRVTIEEQWQNICKDFNSQVEQIESLDNNLQYFDTYKIWDHRKGQKLLRLIAHITSYKFFILIIKIYNWIRGNGFEI